MTRYTQECPHCYSEIDDRATVCPICRRDTDELDYDYEPLSPSKKKKGCLMQWKYTPIVLVILAVICGVTYLGNLGEDNGDEKAPARSLPPTYTPRGRSFEESLKDEINSELANFDYDEGRLRVTEIETKASVLIAHLEQLEQNSLEDYWGQLGIVHGVIARNEPDFAIVRTINVKGQNGFNVRMDDLVYHYNGGTEFEEFRERWEFFEP